MFDKRLEYARVEIGRRFLLAGLPVHHVEVTSDRLFCGGTLATDEPARILERACELLT